MEIPYNTVVRPDTGAWNSKIGVWLFLASEVMLFGGLFSAYAFLRGGFEAHGIPWPHHVLDWTLGFVNSLILISSSVSVILAWAALKMRKFGQFKVAMGVTLALAFAFLGVKSYEYSTKFEHEAVVLKSGELIVGHIHEHGDEVQVTVEGHGHAPAEKTFHKDEIKSVGGKLVVGHLLPNLHPFYAIYWAMTGIHVLHVIGGILVLGYFWLFSGELWRHNPEHVANRVEVGGLYWHFVDVVWIFLFPLLYLM